MITILSSNGFFIIDTEGNILEDNYEGEHEIAKFDVSEYFQTYSNEKYEDVGTIDILDIGYWLKNGEYEAPDAEFRMEVKENDEFWEKFNS